MLLHLIISRTVSLLFSCPCPRPCSCLRTWSWSCLPCACPCPCYVHFQCPIPFPVPVRLHVHVHVACAPCTKTRHPNLRVKLTMSSAAGTENGFYNVWYYCTRSSRGYICGRKIIWEVSMALGLAASQLTGEEKFVFFLSQHPGACQCICSLSFYLSFPYLFSSPGVFLSVYNSQI